VDEWGRRVGTHRGVIHYTVGQRKGLGLALPERWYVLAIDAAANTVTLGPRASLERLGLVTERANWLAPSAPPAGTRAHVCIRYNHAGGMATLTPREDGGVEVRFDEPQIAVTPGQLAGFYVGDRCLGGAEIRHGIPGPVPAMSAAETEAVAAR
jgi:tRNA-specific 2-thiouridylase